MHYNRVDLSYRPFYGNGVAAAIRKAGRVLHLRHLGEHGFAFLTELFNLSVAGVYIQAFWKNSVIIPILKAGKPRDQSRYFRSTSLDRPDSEDIGAAPLPVHCGGTGYTPLPALLQTEALHRLGHAPHLC